MTRRRVYFTESAGTTLMLSTPTRVVGVLRSGPRHWRITEFCQHVIAFNQFAERRVLMIEMRRRARGR